MKIQASRVEQPDTGPLRKHKVTSFWGSERTSRRRQRLSLALKSEEDLGKDKKNWFPTIGSSMSRGRQGEDRSS